MGIVENSAEVVPAGKDTVRRLLRDTLLLAAAFFLVAAALDPVFGSFLRKKGIFFHGVRSQGEYMRVWQVKHGGADTRPIALEQEHVVHVHADGTAEAACALTFAYMGRDGIAVLERMHVAGTDVRVETIEGASLEWSRQNDGDSETFKVQLPPGVDRFVLHNSYPLSQRLENVGARWKYDFHHSFGHPIWYRHVIKLPPGATLGTLRPAPTLRTRSGEGWELRYERELGSDFWGNWDRFECRFDFELPAT